MFIFIIFYSLYKNKENTFESCFNCLIFFKGKFSYFYTFNTFICILINIKLILISSRFDLKNLEPLPSPVLWTVRVWKPWSTLKIISLNLLGWLHCGFHLSDKSLKFTWDGPLIFSICYSLNWDLVHLGAGNGAQLTL